MPTNSATWPDSFIYVCSATQASIVNTTPISSAGINRIAAVVIFCGALDPEIQEPNIKASAINPARELETTLARDSSGRLSDESGSILTVYGDPSDVSIWQTRMRQVFERFPAPQPVVFNIKGGLKEMALGGMSRGIGDERFIAVTVRGQPLGTEQIWPGTQRALPMAGTYPSIDDYLRAYGYAEVTPSLRNGSHPRQTWQRFVQSHQNKLTPFAGALYCDPDIISECNIIGSNCFADPKERNFKTYVFQPKQAMANALALLNGLPGLQQRGDEPGTWQINHPGTARLLKGKWLEAALYLEARKKLRGLNGVEIAAGLQISSPGGTDPLAEFDLAVLIRGQLHLVEVKTTARQGARNADAGDRSFSQFQSVSRLLIGQVGNSFFVNPRLRSSPIIETRAKQAGVEVLLGPTAVTEVVERLVGLANAGGK